MAKRTSIPPKVRWSVLARDGFRCRYCGARGGDAVLVVDHAHPVARGGRDDIANLITACEECNQGKSDSLTPTFAELALYRDAAEVAAGWLYFDWIELVRTDHPAKVPKVATFMRVVRASQSYAEAREVLGTVAARYHAGAFGPGDWPGLNNQGLTVDETLTGYAEWLGWRHERPEAEDEGSYKARFWEETPF